MLDRELVIFDVETTGLDPQNDYIVELSAVKYDTNFEVIEKYNQRFDVPIQIPEEVSAIHGITNTDLEGFPTFSEEMFAIAAFFAGCDVGGYNVMFDLKFLSAEYERVNRPMTGNFKIIDVMKIYAKYEPRTLSAVYKRLFSEELESAHSAEADVIATGRVLQELVNREFCKLNTKELQSLSDTTKIADFAGKFTRDDEGYLYWNFGKNFGKRVEDDPGYYKWFLNADFPKQSKRILEVYLSNLQVGDE